MSSGDKTDNKVTADSYGKVYVDEADQECWMLRVPPKLAAAWEKMPEGAVLGELVFRKGGKAAGPGKPAVKPSLQVDVAPHVATDEHARLPLQYSLQAMTKKLPTLHPFTRHSNGSVSIHGKVTRTANLQVHQDANYRQLCKTRILQSTVHNSRYVKPVESNQVVSQSSKGSGKKRGFGQTVHQYGKRLLEAADQQSSALLQNKRSKYSFTTEQTTKSVVFALFSQQPYWTMKDLKVASLRPENEIRDVLREVGDYHRSGDHKSTWALRKEFQVQNDEGTGGDAQKGNGDANGATSGSG